MRVAAYTRVSTRDQSEGASLEAQREQLARWCEDEGHELVRVYADVASGRLSERPALLELLDDAEKGMFDAVVCTETDRIARGPELRGWVAYTLKRAGVELVELDKREEDTPEARLFNAILEALSRFETERRQARIERAKRERIRQGIPITRVPFGYRKRGDKMWVVEDEARVVREIYELHAQGVGYRRIAQRYSMPTSTIRHILSNPIYRGLIRVDGELVRGSFEPIIKGELLEGGEGAPTPSRGGNAGIT